MITVPCLSEMTRQLRRRTGFDLLILFVFFLSDRNQTHQDTAMDPYRPSDEARVLVVSRLLFV